MSNTYKSPFATAFKAGVNRGTSYNHVVWNIAKRSNKSPEFVWESLFKANLCWRQKFNGQWIYFPCELKKSNATTVKFGQYNMWQWFCEWCLTSGTCTPEQLHKHHGSQKEFMTWCRKFWSAQYTTAKTTKKRPVSKSRNYSFATATKSRSTRRKAA